MSAKIKPASGRLTAVLLAVMAAVLLLVACEDPEAELEDLGRHLAQLAWQREATAREAESLETLIAAVQAGDELVEFSPVAEDGGIAGFKVVFKDAGEIVIYNQPSYISVTEDDGHYYWMAGGRYLTDSSGNRLEISPETPVPQFRVNAGVLEVSADGGNRFTRLGNIDKCLIESVSEDASQVVFRLSGGAVVTIPKPQALKLYMDGDGRSIGAGETVTVTYRIEGAENAGITAICGDGWRVEVTPATSTEGTIKVTAPSPVSEDKVIVFASDGKGRMVAVEMRLTVDESTNPEPPGPEVILRPVSQAYNVTKAGGEIVAPLVTNVEYTVSTDAAWLRYAGTKGERTDNLVFTVQPNDDAARAAVATISSGNYSTTIAFYQAGEARTLELSEYGMEFDSGGGSRFLTVTSNIDYEFEVSDGWVTIVQPNVVTPSIYVVTVEANPTISDRSASITFSGDRVPTRVLEITQEGQAPYMTVTGGPFEFGNDGGSGSVTVAANVEVGYTIEGGEGWLEITAQTEPGKYLLTVSRNDSFDARAATVTFSGDGVQPHTIKVCQSAETPYLDISANSISFGCDGGAEVLTVTANVEVIYEIEGDGWITVSAVGNTGRKFAVKAASNNYPGERTAAIVFSGERVAPQTVTVSQAGRDPYMTISLNSIYFDSEGGASGFSVSSNVPYTISCSDDSWLTVSGAPETGLAFFSVSAGLNSAYVARTAIINFESEALGSRQVRVTQAAGIPPEPATVVYLDGEIPPAIQSVMNAGGEVSVKTITQDDTELSFSFSNGGEVVMARSETMSLTVDDARAIIRGGGTVDVPYRISGVAPSGGTTYVTVLFYADGWDARIVRTNAVEGIIRLTAPDPAVRCGMLVIVSDTAGKMVMSELHLKIEALSSTGPIPVSHIMPCCRVNNAGTRFLVGRGWTESHQYSYINDVRSILQKIQDAGINTVCIDFTNPSQWDAAGEAALHNSTGEFWYQFKPMLQNIIQVCEEKDMEYILFIGELRYWGIDYWNNIAGRILSDWISPKAYRRYGYGDDKPLLVVFTPGSDVASLLARSKPSQKNNLLQFRIGTCQINSPITPTVTDGWGYRNYSGSSDGKVRFACPNGGVPPQDWYRVNAAEWRRRVQWAMEATEYAVLGSYDDTCDAIFWGVADVSRSTSSYHRNPETENDPYIYYNIVRDELVGME